MTRPVPSTFAGPRSNDSVSMPSLAPPCEKIAAMSGARLLLSAPASVASMRQLVQIGSRNARQARLDLDVVGQIGRDLRRQAWTGQLIEAEFDPGVQPPPGRLAAKAEQQVLDRQSAHAGDLDLQPIHRFLEAHAGQHVLQGLRPSDATAPERGRTDRAFHPWSRCQAAARRSGRRWRQATRRSGRGSRR